MPRSWRASPSPGSASPARGRLPGGGQEVVLEANPDSWGGRPKVGRVVIRPIKDSARRLVALKAGEIHGLEGLDPDDVATVSRDPGLTLLLRPADTTRY